MKKVTKKVTKKELENLKQSVDSINGLQMQIGGIEAQKHELLHALSIKQGDLYKFQEELKEKYGDVTVNISTGEIIEDELVKKD